MFLAVSYINEYYILLPFYLKLLLRKGLYDLLFFEMTSNFLIIARH